MTGPQERPPQAYHGVTYRCVQGGRMIETVTVPLGEYEDQRLSLEVEYGENGWERVAAPTELGGLENVEQEGQGQAPAARRRQRKQQDPVEPSATPADTPKGD